ncbi:TetR/AcrR family transcriptional regulator [Microbacterium sp. ZW T5_56]|uniref:TetR/AcrR family transcriptional regulator n=1 Tax=Microbacterium sp. ZW T5_56 TaxID=3378081 RepID=UPI003853B45E
MAIGSRAVKPRPATLEKRRDILRAATDVFGAKGYAGGTLADIADQVGMTHAGILHHFGSKDQLLLDVLTFRDRTDVEHLAEQHIPGGVDLFRHLIRTAFANARRAGIVQAFVVLSGESVTDSHPAREYFAGRYGTLRGEIANAFTEMCRERGVTDTARLADAAAAILGVMDGLQVQWLHAPGDVDLGRATAFAINAIVRAVIDGDEPILGGVDEILADE